MMTLAAIDPMVFWTALGSAGTILGVAYGVRQQFMRWKADIRRAAIAEAEEAAQEKADREKLDALNKLVQAMQASTEKQTRELKQDSKERGEKSERTAVKTAEVLADKVADTATELASKVAKAAAEVAHGVSEDLAKHKIEVSNNFAAINKRLDEGNVRMDGMAKSIEKISRNGNGHE